MKKPAMIAQTGACLVEPAIAFAVMGTCVSTAISLVCGWLAVIG